MKITIEISKEAVDKVIQIAKQVSGKEPSEKQLKKFFAQDVEGVYGNVFGDGIEDAVESYFY